MIGSLSERERTEFLASLTETEASELLYRWDFWARPEQLTPKGDWQTFLYLAGRGAGKTRSGAEWVRGEIESGRKKNVALIAPTTRDARKTIVEGESGLLAICPPWNFPAYEPSKLQLTWPNGGKAHLYSAEEPNRLRGPNHDAAWCDEIASWVYGDETWNNLEMTLRAGVQPKRYITTTPVPPTSLLRSIAKDPSTIIVKGSTFDNADNLAPEFIARIRDKYEGTRIGRGEIYAEILEDVEGALWSRRMIDMTRVQSYPPLRRVVVAIDPAVTSNEQSDETGIIVAGVGVDGHGYVLSDISGRYRPDNWARVAIDAYHRWQGDRIVAEVNNGGEMVEHTLRTVERFVPYKDVHASRGKSARADPIAALAEQGRVHHVGMFPELEDQMCNWQPLGKDRSPDRLDAMVWALTELMVEAPKAATQTRLRI